MKPRLSPSPEMLEQRLGFVGAGQMARALASGMVTAGLLSAERITAFDPVPKAGEEFAALVPGVRLAAGNAAVAQASDVVILRADKGTGTYSEVSYCDRQWAFRLIHWTARL